MKCFILFCLLLPCLLLRSYAQQHTIPTPQQEQPSDHSWWQTFGDSQLDDLIRTAIANNNDLQNAIKNIEIARSRLRQERGNFFPSVSASAQYSPEKTSMGIDRLDGYNRVGQVGVEMNWEADVFGSIRKNVKAQKEYYLASQEDYRGVMLSLTAEVTTAYIQLRSYQQQQEVATRNLKSQEEILQLNESRYTAGLSSRLTVAQAKGLWLQTKAALPAIEISVATQVNSLSVLTGIYPDSLRQQLQRPKALPVNNSGIVTGIPAHLMRQRPDVLAAERQVEALAATVGASKAEWWPKFFISGMIGYGNQYFKQLFEQENLTWQISPSVKWTLFSGREIAETTKIARLQLDQGINNFNQIMLTALQEIDNALFAYNKSLQQLDSDRQALEQMQLTLEYATELYKKGLADYQSVLDSQRNVWSYENTLVNTQSSTLLYLIQLYKAIGGGTQSDIGVKTSGGK